MKSPQSAQTLVTLANAGELVAGIALSVMGNDIADSFAGSPLTRGIIYNLAQVQFQSTLSNQLGNT